MTTANVHTLSATVYEFKGSYFVIEEAQQGTKALITAHQRPEEIRALGAKLPTPVDVGVLGQEARAALERFDIEPPAYDSWQPKELTKQMVGWLGARGFATIVKNSRRVKLRQILQTGEITVFPGDNHQAHPWYGLLEDKALVLQSTCTDEELGKVILQAFALSTYHPDRTDAKES